MAIMALAVQADPMGVCLALGADIPAIGIGFAFANFGFHGFTY
jgi:hypothetical protein